MYNSDKQAPCYRGEMREDLLKSFFVGDESIYRLAEDVSAAALRIDPVHSTIQITDMEGMFSLTREHIMLLCDATLSQRLTADALTTIAFALLASDHFDWSDDVISEVLQDWSCPEINFPLVDSVLKMHRDWLTGAASPPERPSIGSAKSAGHIVSEKRKVRL